MAQYSQVWDSIKNAISTDIIFREDDNAWIPTDPDNIDYQEYLAWLDEGNKPNPPSNIPAQQTGETT